MVKRNVEPFDYDPAVTPLGGELLKRLGDFKSVNLYLPVQTRAQARKLVREIKARVLPTLESLPGSPYVLYARVYHRADAKDSKWGAHVHAHTRRSSGPPPDYTPPSATQ